MIPSTLPDTTTQIIAQKTWEFFFFGSIVNKSKLDLFIHFLFFKKLKYDMKKMAPLMFSFFVNLNWQIYHLHNKSLIR